MNDGDVVATLLIGRYFDGQMQKVKVNALVFVVPVPVGDIGLRTDNLQNKIFAFHRTS